MSVQTAFQLYLDEMRELLDEMHEEAVAQELNPDELHFYNEMRTALIKYDESKEEEGL